MNVVLPEIVAVGIYNSQIAVRGRTVTKNRKTTMFEIELPMEHGGMSHINDEAMPIEPNRIICAKPGQVRHTRLPFKCYYIHMIVREGPLYDMLADIPTFVSTEKHERYREIFEEMNRYFGTSLQKDEIILQSLVLKLVYSLSEDCEKLRIREREKASNYKLIERVIKHIKSNLTSDLTLGTMAEYAGFSPIHFHNLFRSATGRTLHEYVEEQRIKKAKNMLIATDSTLTEIAYECGFSSQSYFSYAFKRRVGVTPREYAKKMLKRYDAE